MCKCNIFITFCKEKAKKILLMQGFGHFVPTSLSTRRRGPSKPKGLKLRKCPSLSKGFCALRSDIRRQNSSLSEGLCALRIPSPPAAGTNKGHDINFRSSFWVQLLGLFDLFNLFDTSTLHCAVCPRFITSRNPRNDESPAAHYLDMLSPLFRFCFGK